MKKFKSIIAVISLLFVWVTGTAVARPTAPKSTKEDVINMYINAVTNGATEKLQEVLDRDMQFNLLRGENIQTLSGIQWLKSVKDCTVVNQPVNITTTVVQLNENSAKIKVVFKYVDFERDDIVTLNIVSSWKITNVDSQYK